MESILTSIKKLLGIQADYTHFDMDIIMHINGVFMILNQLGVGPENGFTIKDDTTTWSEFLEDDNIEAAKIFTYMKVRIIFDPPSTGTLFEALERQISEYEWRLNNQAERKG